MECHSWLPRGVTAAQRKDQLICHTIRLATCCNCLMTFRQLLKTCSLWLKIPCRPKNTGGAAKSSMRAARYVTTFCVEAADMATTFRQRAAWSVLILGSGFVASFVYGLILLTVLDAVLP